MGLRKQKWGKGDAFLIPLDDGSNARGQVVEPAPDALNSVVCAFWSQRIPFSEDSPLPLPKCEVIAVLFVTRDLLDSGRWKVVSHNSGSFTAPLESLEEAKRNRFVGVTIYGSSIIEILLNALLGLRPWGEFHDPQYLDKLLSHDLRLSS